MIARRSITLTTNRVAALLAAIAALALAAQVGLGASVLVVLLATIAVGAGLLAFLMQGAYSIGGWFALIYVGGNVLVGLVAKTLMGQPLETHLYAPVLSFVVVAASSIALLAALLLAARLNVGRPLLTKVPNAERLAWLSWGSFVLGVGFWFLNQHFQDPGGSGFGGFAVFRDLLLMAVIARTALILQRTDDRRSFDSRLAIILSVSVALGLLTNSKTYAAYPVVSYFATILFFRRGLTVVHLVTLAVALVVFVRVVTPLIQAWRYLGIQRMPAAERVTLMQRNIADLFNGTSFQKYALLATLDFRGGYYNYFGGAGRGQMLLGRYASVQQIDPVVAQVGLQGPMGGAAVWPAFARQLPSVLYPNKPRFSDAYSILVHFGLVDPAGGKYPTLPLAGQAFAAYGFSGVALIPFLAFLGMFVALKKFGWQLYHNVFAIFVLSEFVIVYASQGDLAQYLGLVVRGLPAFFVVLWLLTHGPRFRLRRAYPAFVPVQVTIGAKDGRP